MAAHKLMRIFKQQKRSLAVVVDEFGGVSGIVALEDLIEEILGDKKTLKMNMIHIHRRQADIG